MSLPATSIVNCSALAPSARQTTLAPSSETETVLSVAVLISVVLFDSLIFTKKLPTVPFNGPLVSSNFCVPSPCQTIAPPVPLTIQVRTNL